MHIASVPVPFYPLISQRKEMIPFAVQKPAASVLTADCPFSRLPSEIISHILESAYYDDNLDPDVQLFSSCALVHRRWTVPSQALLFRHVVLRSSSAFVSFHSAVDPTTTRGQTLGSNVVRLRIIIDHNHPDQLSHRALAAAILSCSNLYELDLAVYGCGVPGSSPVDASGIRIFRAAPSFDAGILELLRAGPLVRSLKFANWSDNDQLAFQLLSGVWPSLTAVSLKGTTPRMPAFEDQPVLPFGCALSELNLNFQNAPSGDFVSWLLQVSRRSIRRLELERIPGTGFLRTLLRQCSPSLDSLALPSCTSRDHVDAIHGCERLKEFRFESTNVSPVLLKQLPASVEHLAFSVSRDTPLYLMVNFVKARRHLKAVTMHVWDDAVSHPQIPDMRMACANNAVELLIMRGIRRFREAVRGDPVVPYSSYPRLKNPANLRKMLCVSRYAREGESSRSLTGLQHPRAESAAVLFSRPMLSEIPAASNVSIADGHHEKL